MEGASAVISAGNERGGVNGTRVQLLVEDDQFDPVQGKRKVQQLIQQGVHGFVGTATPGTAPQALPDLDAAGTPVTGGALGFTPVEAKSKVFFPVMQLCDHHMSAAVDYALKEFKAKRFAIFYVDIAAARDCAVAGARIAEKLGAGMVYEGRVAPGAPDCTPHVVNARSRDAEVVILGVDQLGIVKCKQAALQQGWKAPFVGGYNNIEDSFYKEALGEDGADQIFSGMPFAGTKSPEWERLCGGPLRRFFPKADPYVIYTIGCLAAHQYLEVLRAIGPGASRAQFIEHLEKGNPIRSNGVAPDMVYRPGDHNPYQVTRPWALRKGKWQPVADAYVPPA
jgi:branched-chain amino acid transport system substrate-binding protein